MSDAKTATTGASLPNISTLLSAARQEKRVTLEQASLATKIKLEYLQKLEKGDFSFLPAPYVYAMLKQYGKALQIDPEVLKKCRADLGILTDETLHATVTASQENVQKSPFDNPEHKKWGIIAAATLGAVLLIILIVQLFSGPPESEVIVKKAAETEQPKAAPAQEPHEAQPAADQSPANLPAAQPTIPTPAPATAVPQTVQPIPPATPGQNTPVLSTAPATLQVKKVLIKTKNDTSWVKVSSVDGGFVRESMIPPNQSRAYETRMGFTVSIGKAEAVEVYVDGKLVPLPKNKGRVNLTVGN